MFAEKIDGSEGPRLVARLDYTGGEPAAFSPTSVIATGIEYQGLDIELYTRPRQALYLNGVETTLPSNVPTEVATNVIITRNVFGGHSVSMPEMYVEYTGINLSVTVDPVGGFGGILGTNNETTADDILVRDPADRPDNWERLTLAEARAQGDRAREFVESWRLADTDDSPLSLPFERFGAVSQFSLDSELIAPYRAQATSLLSGVAEICSGTDNPDNYAIDVFAIELAIGTDPALLGCDYEFHGRVVTDSPTIPVVGAEVTVDAPGLLPCSTVTGPTGGYSCVLGIDFDELDALDVGFPFDATVDVAGAGQTVPAATGSVAVAAPSELTKRLYTAVDDIVLPIDQTVALELTGALAALGAPFTAPTGFLATATDAAGEVVAKVSLAVTPDAAGDYQTLVAMPLTTADIAVAWQYGIDAGDHPTATFGGFAAGLNQRVFDADYDPPVVDLSGIVLYNGVPQTVAVITVEAQRAVGGPFTQRFRVDPDIDGRYSVDVLIPVDTTSVTASARLGSTSNDLIQATLSAVQPRSNPLVLDIVQDAPVLNLAGQLEVNGAPGRNTTFVVEFAGGATQATAIVNQTTGSYALGFDLPAGTTEARVTAFVGQSSAEHRSLDVSGLVNGSNSRTFDINTEPPVLTVSGTAAAGGVPIDDPFYVRFDTIPGAPQRLALPDASGAFAISLTLPEGTTTVDVTARIGRGPADWATTTLIGLVPGPNARTFDPTFAAVGLDLTGVVQVNGAAQSGTRNIHVVSFDAADAVIDTFDVAVQVGLDGSYAEPVQVPPATRTVELMALVGPYPTLRTPESFVVNPGANSIDYSTNAQLSTLRVSGTLTAGGRFLSGPFDFRTDFDILSPGGGTTRFTVNDEAIVNGLDGTYSFERLVPELAVAAEVTALTSVNPANNISVVVDPVPAGLVLVDLSGDPAIPVDIAFTGVLGEADGPFVGAADVTYVLRAGNGSVVDQATVQVTTNSNGQFTLPFQADSTVTEISMAWLVGVPGEAPVFKTVTGLRPGANTVTIAHVYDPPIIEIVGSATFNGDPLDDDIIVDVAITGGSAAGFTEVLATDPSTGAFTSTRTLERGATEVDVTATTTDDDNPVVTVADVALVGGLNPIAVDVAVERTNLQVAGTMSVSGTVPSGLVDVQVIAKAVGRPNQTATVQVDPDDTSRSLRLRVPPAVLGHVRRARRRVDRVSRPSGRGSPTPTSSSVTIRGCSTPSSTSNCSS